jgi:outer membrane PBP1 activator LpoA protein
VRDGAQFVIGPLRKEEVEALAQRGNLTAPVLALNTIDSNWLPAGLYQFGLAPEEEARQVAERAWLDGHTRAAMITPNGPWGTRIAQAFRDRWTELGGQVVTSAGYESQENDYAAPLRAMFALDASDRRHNQVENVLGRSLEFTPRRRQDVDFIFLAAFPRQARLLRPQIKFHHATDLPVYATSHVFTGTMAPEEDRDMDGAVFGDMPWVLEGLQPAALKRHEGQMARLVALGVDAYNLLRYLRLLENYPAERYEGGTGELQLDDKRRVQRQLAWARFISGRPRPLELEAVLPRAAAPAAE